MKYNYGKYGIFAIVVLGLFVLVSCHSPAPCFNEDTEQTEMKWGSYKSEDRTYSGYKLHSNGLIQKYYRDTSGVETAENIAYISHDDVCRILKYYYWVMKKVQTCYEPGENLKYLTLVNDKYNTYWNVVWNQDFNTGSNKYLKVVYDSLLQIVHRIDK